MTQKPAGDNDYFLLAEAHLARIKFAHTYMHAHICAYTYTVSVFLYACVLI